MTGCADRMVLLHGLIDGELDAANSVSVEAHAKTCMGCAEELRRLKTIQDLVSAADVRHPAPHQLRDRIAELVEKATAPASPQVTMPPRRPGASRLPWMTGAVGAMMGASLALLFATPQFTNTGVQDQIVAGHVRSLLESHLIDVATSDQHRLKPWFNGRIDFAPPVVELADQGFPLIGGRLDYIGGRVVPVLVYQRRRHPINLFIRPAGKSSAVTVTTQREGYSLARWTDDGLEFWAISDVNPDDLQLFRRAFALRLRREL